MWSQVWWWAVFSSGWFVFLVWLIHFSPVFGTVNRHTLRRKAPLCPECSRWPRLSVIVPARDEGPNIRAGLESLLQCDYPDLEIIAVNDRSTDNTGAIMDEIAARDARLRVVHLTELPAGWLGKNHAMWRARQMATGELLLFTDGDVLFEPQSLKMAVRYVEHHQLDFLSLFPHMIPGGYWENAVVVFFSLVFLSGTRPHLIRSPNKTAYAGVGAFNLVRASRYDATGGHERLRMEILDDVRLGQLLKDHDYPCDVLLAGPPVSVRWQPSFWGSIKGLEKNGFAAMGYSLWNLAYATFGIYVGSIGPYVVVALLHDWRASGFWATIAVMHSIYGYLSWKALGSWALTPVYPFAAILTHFAFARSAWITLRQGGVRWRDTFYPLDLLRERMYLQKRLTDARETPPLVPEIGQTSAE